MVAILGLVGCAAAAAASVLCHLRCLLLDCCEEIRRHCEDREYCWRAASWHDRVMDLAGAVADMAIVKSYDGLDTGMRRLVAI